MKKIIKAINNPLLAYKAIHTISKGYWYKLWYQYILRKAQFGKDFRADGKLSIKGPGKVIFGDHIRIGMTVTPWTYSKEARITIGDRTFLNGTRFACQEHIGIGDDGIFADCRIMDTDFHSVHPNKRDQAQSAPIYIDDKVWITIQCVVLKGVHIWSGVTVTPNSVVSKDLPNNVVAGGNPAKVIKVIKNV